MSVLVKFPTYLILASNARVSSEEILNFSSDFDARLNHRGQLLHAARSQLEIGNSGTAELASRGSPESGTCGV